VNKKLIELDSLRALMAFAVFVSHAQFLSATEIWSFSLGGLAVTVFIMLSGFAITKSLIGSDASYRQYIARRFWRIYPVYLVGGYSNQPGQFDAGLPDFMAFLQHVEISGNRGFKASSPTGASASEPGAAPGPATAPAPAAAPAPGTAAPAAAPAPTSAAP